MNQYIFKMNVNNKNYEKYLNLKNINNHKIITIIGISICLFIYFPKITFIIGIVICLLLYIFKINININNVIYEEFSYLLMNKCEFIQSINYHKISSIIGNHNVNQDSYLYLLLIENAYDSCKDEYINYIKIGYTNNNPKKEFYNIYRDFYPMGEIKILTLIKTEKAEFIEKKIKKELNSNLKEIINIYSRTNQNKSIESYSYDSLYLIKCVLNFTLLEYKNLIYSYYVDEENEFVYNYIRYIIDNEIAHKIDISEYEMDVK